MDTHTHKSINLEKREEEKTCRQMVHYRRGVAMNLDRGWPKRQVNERTTPPVHIQDGSGWGQVPPLGWREREEQQYSCRRPERQTGVEEWTALRRRHASPGNSSVSGQPVGLPQYRCDFWTARGARTKSWAAVGTGWRVQMKGWGRPTQVDS